MENTSSSQMPELKLPTAPLTPSNDFPGLTGAIAPIQMGSELFPSFDFMFSSNHNETSS